MSHTINLENVKRILIVRLRSIGDTVLSTPTLIALKRFLPESKIEILLEDWVAPVLEGFDAVDDVIRISGDDWKSRLKIARELRARKYDLAINLHGGTTATFFTRASGAKMRVGYQTYQYSFLYTHLLSSSKDFWKAEQTHSAEQQLALAGFLGVPVEDRPKSRLAILETDARMVESKVRHAQSVIRNQFTEFALIHPTAAFATKEWPTENFAQIAEYLYARNILPVAIAAKHERAVLEDLKKSSRFPVVTFDDLPLPEITALASQAQIFVGNDSGIAHIAAAVNCPSVVIFGSSNRNHWRPWTAAPNEIVYEEFPCQPCAGYTCEVFGEPKCILSVTKESVISAINQVMASN
jgi:lipopolysaccharide heptosyltransferase II